MVHLLGPIVMSSRPAVERRAGVATRIGEAMPPIGPVPARGWSAHLTLGSVIARIGRMGRAMRRARADRPTAQPR
jgi:hypothetical protein